MKKEAISIIKTLQDAGFVAVFAGGCVRDMLLGKEPKDFDIATSAKPREVLEFYPHSVLDGESNGVIKVIHDKVVTDVATLRKDGSYTDGRRPDWVEFTDSLQEDSCRRDFTINALFHDPIKDELIDFHDGQKHLWQKSLKAVGTASDRYLEDKLRMMRAVRFACQLNFQIEDIESISKHSESIRTVSPERIWAEFLKIMGTDLAGWGVSMLEETGLLKHILWELADLRNIPGDPIWHPEGDVMVHSIKALNNMVRMTEDPELRAIALLHDIGKCECWESHVDEEGLLRHSHKGHAHAGAKMMEAICDRFHLSGNFKERSTWLVDNHMKAHIGDEMRLSNLVAFMRNQHFDDLIKLQHADAMASGRAESKSLREFYLERQQTLDLSIKAPSLVTGKDLIALGYKPGRQFSVMLSLAREMQDGGQEDKNVILETIKEGFKHE